MKCIGSQVHQGFENEGVFEDFVTGQLHPVDLAGEIVISEDVDIQGPAREFLFPTHPTMVFLDIPQHGCKLAHRQGGINTHHQVVEGIAGKTHRLAFIDRADRQTAEGSSQCLQAGTNIVRPVDIGAQAQIHPGGLILITHWVFDPFR